MNIPSRVNPLGYDNSLPPGYTSVEFLESTGTQYIDTEWTGGCTAVARYSAIWLDGYAGWENMWGQKLAVSNSRGSLWIPTPNDGFKLYAAKDIGSVVLGQIYEVKHEICDGNINLALSVDGTRDGVTVAGTYDTTISYKLFYQRAAHERLYSFKLSALGDLKRDFIPALDHTGKPCMFDLVTKKPFYNAVTTGADFTVGLTLDQVRNLNLPSTDVTKTLTLSLPAEAGFDYRAQKALSDAREKGWLLTLQYASSVIPHNIRKVEFLEGTSAANNSYQWINTGVQMADNVGIKAKFSVNYGRFATGVGAWYNDSTPAEFLTHVSTHGVAQHHYLSYGWGTPKRPSNRLLGVRAYAIQEGELNWLNSGKAIFSAPKATISALTTSPDTDVPVTATYTLASPPDQPILNYDIYLFALNNNGTPYMFSTAPTRQRIYEASISVDDAEHTHFVAAIDQTGTPYMFDTIGSRLVENSGTGAFAVGIATVEEVRDLYIPEAPVGASLKLSVPADTPDSAIDALQAHNPNLQIEIVYR